MAVQVACSPKLEREADELDRHGDGDAAAKRREDLRLATVASDVGAFKSSVRIHTRPSRIFGAGTILLTTRL